MLFCWIFPEILSNSNFTFLNFVLQYEIVKITSSNLCSAQMIVKSRNSHQIFSTHTKYNTNENIYVDLYFNPNFS